MAKPPKPCGPGDGGVFAPFVFTLLFMALLLLAGVAIGLKMGCYP